MQQVIPEVARAARYDRQKRIAGWNQEKLEKARIGIIGGGPLAQFTALPLAALGFGHVEIYDISKIDIRNRDDFLCSWARKDTYKTAALEEILKQINPHSDTKGVNMQFRHPSQALLMNSLDLIIDCTNDPFSKLIALEYGKATSIPVITAASSPEIGELALSKGKFDEGFLFPEYSAKSQSVMTSMVIGGLIADEARKLVMPLNDRPLEKIVAYNRHSKERTGYANNVETNPGTGMVGSHVVLVGAGALGNFVGLGLAIHGIEKLTVFDDDVVEETNLNRQVLFYDAVGRYKAEALVEKLARINSKIDYVHRKSRVGKGFGKFLRDEKPDLLIDSVDNFKTRALLNYFARTTGIPLISGGTDFKSGQAAVYVPGKTSCLQCQLTIDDLALQSLRPQSCVYAAEPSVIVSNQVVGGMITGEAYTVLAPQDNGEPIKGVLKYSSTEPERIGMLGSRDACKCNEQTKEEHKEWWNKMGKLYIKKGEQDG